MDVSQKMKPTKTSWYEFKKEGADWILYVLCGGIAQFERKLILSEDEVRFVDEYDYYLEKLALDVARTPDIFGKRIS